MGTCQKWEIPKPLLLSSHFSAQTHQTHQIRNRQRTRRKNFYSLQPMIVFWSLGTHWGFLLSRALRDEWTLHVAAQNNHLITSFSNHFALRKSPSFITSNELSSVTRKRYKLKLLIAFRDHPVVGINFIQQLIFNGDSFKHDPTSYHKVYVVSMWVEQFSNLLLILMMIIRCPPPSPAKINYNAGIQCLGQPKIFTPLRLGQTQPWLPFVRTGTKREENESLELVTSQGCLLGWFLAE